MSETARDSLRRADEYFMGRLVRGDYAAVEQRSGGERLSADELERAISDYERTLESPDEGCWDTVDVDPIGDGEDEFAVAAPLWTREEGRSDLTLELTRTKTESGTYYVEVDDLHVL